MELISYNTNVFYRWKEVALARSVADPERFDADPDPIFQADADPYPAPKFV